MADGTVGWHLFDAESDHISQEFSSSILPGGGEGRTVILAATPFAQSDGWAAKAVVGLARSWSQENLRIFLMDLGLETPSLHKPLGLLNQEGVSDAFLYGASVQRIAQPALDDAIFFAPAGTATTDPEQILGHPRWNDLAGGFSEADATLLLYLPTDISGAEKILAWATDILFLAGEGESVEDHLGPAAVKVVASFGPAGAPSDPVREEGAGTFDSMEPDQAMAGLADPGSEEAGLDLSEGLSIAPGFTRVAEGEEPAEEAAGDDFILEGRGGELGPDGLEVEEEGVTGPDIPDFAADFVDMPELEEGAGSEGVEEGLAEGEFQVSHGDILVGSDIDLETEFSPEELDTSPAGEASAPPAKEAEAPSPPREKPQFRRDRPRPLSDRRKARRKLFTARRVSVGVVIVGLLAVLFGTARGVFDIPGLMWLQDLFYEIPPPALEVEGRDPVGPVLRYSLELKTYDQDELELAIEMRDALRARDPQLLFNLSPMLVDGAVTYILYAGPAADAVEAENLRAPLEGIFEREDPESWRPVVTSRAFYLGRETTLEGAQDLVESVEAQGALAYILRTAYSDGSEGFEVLSGSFETAEEARWWQEDLHRRGFEDLALVDRRGSPPE
ncbi:MAG: hypothetical protein PVJ76_00575 [Gemmatimonadota bacterium]|jgi:hypothetical protein